MNTKHNSITNHLVIPNQTSPWSSDAGLSVTVISTTEKGTIAALKAANSLAADLDAAITLLNLEIVPTPLPLSRSAASIKYAMKQQRSVLRLSALNTADVDLKIRLCRDWSDGAQRLLRRRTLIVIGGKRHWWARREEKLERVLRGLGHHVIFIDVGQEPNRTSLINKFGFFLKQKTGTFTTTIERKA